VVVLLLLPDGGDDLLEVDATDNVVIVTPGNEAPEPRPRPTPVAPAATDGGSDVATDAAVAPAPSTEPATAVPILKPDLPQPPRRLPHRASRCTQPPPGGPEQYRAVEAARRRECALSLEAVQAGMKKSIDHCRLYQQAWLCFNETHERPLEQVEAFTFADLQFELWHFEGTRDKSTMTKELETLPAWYRPAVDGLEYRLEVWNVDEDMADYVADLFGEPKVADDVARDVHIEALAAAGLARAPLDERTPAMIDAWARRVYVVASALNGRAGRVLNQHRTSLVPTLRELLEQAVADRTEPDGRVVKTPDAVREAYDVGTGNKPPPTSKPVVRRDPNQFK
jgi:hypothetical protein